jgi:hypothetical protein
VGRYGFEKKINSIYLMSYSYKALEHRLAHSECDDVDGVSDDITSDDDIDDVDDDDVSDDCDGDEFLSCLGFDPGSLVLGFVIFHDSFISE